MNKIEKLKLNEKKQKNGTYEKAKIKETKKKINK